MIAAIVLAALGLLGWLSAAMWWYFARRWQKVALDEAALVRKLSALLTESIQTTDAALASHAALFGSKLAERDTTSDRKVN